MAVVVVENNDGKIKLPTYFQTELKNGYYSFGIFTNLNNHPAILLELKTTEYYIHSCREEPWAKIFGFDDYTGVPYNDNDKIVYLNIFKNISTI